MEKLSKSNLFRITGITGKQYKKIPWHDTFVYVKSIIPFSEMIGMVEYIVNSCLSKDGLFMPEFLDFSLRVCVLNYYSLVELPESIEDKFYIVYQSDIYDTVIKHINKGQIESIKNSVNMCVDKFARNE